MKDFKDLVYQLSKLPKHNKYVMVSHFTEDPEIPLMNGKSDLDILCDSKITKIRIVKLLQGTKMKKYIFSNAYLIKLDNIDVGLDLFWVKDGFYPRKWCKQMFNRSKKYRGLNILSDEDNSYSFLYHNFFHKNAITTTVLNKMNLLFGVNQKKQDFFLEKLIKYLDSNKFRFSITLDRTKTNNFFNFEIERRKEYPIDIKIKHFIYRIFVLLPKRFIKLLKEKNNG